MNNDLSQLPCTEDNTHVCVEQLHEHMNAFIGNYFYCRIRFQYGSVSF